MRKIYLFDLFHSISNDNLFPKNNDENWSKTVEEYESNGMTIKKETWVSLDGTSSYVKTNIEKKKNIDVKELESKLKIAVENEEYEVAAKLRDQIKELKK